MDQNFLVDQFFKGEPIMWPLLLCLLLALAILIERLWRRLTVQGAEEAEPQLNEAEDMLKNQGEGEGGAVELFRQGRGVLLVLTMLAGPTAVVAQPPAPSANLSANGGYTRVVLQWDAVVASAVVDSYQVQVQSKPAERTRKLQREAPESSWTEAWTLLPSIAADSSLSAYKYVHPPDFTLASGRMYRYQVRAHNADGWSGWSAIFPGATGVQPRPGRPPDLRAEAGAGQVTLRWGLLSDATIKVYKYRYQSSGSAWTAWTVTSPGTPQDTVATITGLTDGTSYQFEVRAHSPAEAGQSAEVSATPQAANAAPEIAGPASVSVSFAENDTSAVSTFTATDPEGDAIEWVLAGKEKDTSAFSVGASSGVLRFDRVPNYEAPADNDANNEYLLWVVAQDDGTPSKADSVWVSVTITDVDDPGTLTLSSLSPQEGVAVTATLTDEDGGIYKDRWTWQRRSGSSAAWADIPSSNATSYTPVVGDVSYQLRATVVYHDSGSEDNQAASEATQAVVDVPGSPALSAVPGDGQVGLRWTAPASDGGRSITDYEYWYSQAGGFTWTTVGGASVDSLTVTGLTNGQEYTFAVRAVNELGAGLADSTKATPQVPNNPPEIKGPASVSVSFAEHDTVQVSTFTATDPDGDAIGWSLAGTDASAFSVGASSGVLRFDPVPNYEAPADTDADNVYQVWVIAQDDGTPAMADSVSVRATVTDVEEDGLVALSSLSPQVGGTVTATLTDPDGQVTGAGWTWQRRAGSSALWTDIPSASDSSYTPVDADVDYQLRATVVYSDRRGGGKQASSEATPAVIGVPRAPALSATSGDGQVGLRWTAPASDGGSPITDYEYWYSDAGGFTWTTVGGGASADSLTVTGLTNGQGHTFAVRAVNALGAGLADSTKATPHAAPVIAGPASVSVSFAEQDTTAVSTFTATDPEGDAIGWSLAGTDASAFSVGASSGVLRFDPVPNYEVPADTDADNEYLLWVVARDDGTPSKADSVAVAVTVTDVDDPGTLTLSSLSPQEGVALTATLRDEDSPLSAIRFAWSAAAGVNWEAVGTSADLGATSAGSDTVYVFTPTATLVGFILRVQATYADPHGSYIKYTPWTEPVFGTTVEDTGVVSLSSTSPQVREALTATLSDPDGTIYGAAWTWQRRSGSSASWADIPSSGASSPDASYTPVEGDVGYHLRARVRYRDDHGAAQDSAHSAATNAVQANVPCAPGLSAKLGDGQVALRWTAPPCDGGSSITHYQYRQEAGSWTEVPGDGSTREHIVSGLTNGTLYTFAVRAVNAVGAGAASNSASATPTDMIAYYPFNGDAQDASGNEYHGTLSGPVPTSDRFGNEASAILFNGTNHRINLPRAVLNGRTNVSVAFWLKTSKTGTQSIISGANQNNENEYLIYFLNKSKLSFYSHGAGPGINEGRCDVTISSIADGYWHHFAVIRNDSQGHADIFIDGTSYTNRCRNLVYNRLVIDAGGLIIGQEQDRVGGGFDASQVFRGALDDLRIYGKALSATEVQALSSEPNPKKVATREKPATSGLTLNFPNPFNASIQITYRLATSGPVRLEIYNVLGQPVKTLVEEFQTVGSYQIHWDARDQRGAAVATGVYFTRLLYPGGVQVRRLLYLK